MRRRASPVEFVEEAGLPTRNIEFKDNAINNSKNILREVRKHGEANLETLIDAVCQ